MRTSKSGEAGMHVVQAVSVEILTMLVFSGTSPFSCKY